MPGISAGRCSVRRDSVTGHSCAGAGCITCWSTDPSCAPGTGSKPSLRCGCGFISPLQVEWGLREMEGLLVIDVSGCSCLAPCTRATCTSKGKAKGKAAHETQVSSDLFSNTCSYRYRLAVFIAACCAATSHASARCWLLVHPCVVPRGKQCIEIALAHPPRPALSPGSSGPPLVSFQLSSINPNPGPDPVPS